MASRVICGIVVVLGMANASGPTELCDTQLRGLRRIGVQIVATDFSLGSAAAREIETRRQMVEDKLERAGLLIDRVADAQLSIVVSAKTLERIDVSSHVVLMVDFKIRETVRVQRGQDSLTATTWELRLVSVVPSDQIEVAAATIIESQVTTLASEIGRLKE